MRLLSFILWLQYTKFQSTHPRGVRLGVRLQSFGNVPISIHAPTWGATWRQSCIRHPWCDFNPRTHVGCDIEGDDLSFAYLISIHAPTWGATMPRYFKTKIYGISIHAPTWGATEPVNLTPRTSTFQSTHPRGVRQLVKTNLGNGVIISIHAPTWGATNSRLSGRPNHTISIHAPTWGATYNREGVLGRLVKFQSTHPRGVRPHFGADLSHEERFQSTPPRGVRPTRSAMLIPIR